MIKRIITVYLALFVNGSVYPQGKPEIDTAIIGTWPYLNHDIIPSNTGKHLAFTISNKPVGLNTLVIQSINGKMRREITSRRIGADFFFSIDDKVLCVRKNDSLLLTYTNKVQTDFLGTVDLLTYPKSNKGKWILFQEKGNSDDVILMNIVNRQKTVYKNIIDATFEENGRTLLLTQKENSRVKVNWIDLDRQTSSIIWNGSISSKVDNFVFSSSGRKLAFLVADSTSIHACYYQSGLRTTVSILDNQNIVLGDSLQISQICGFSKNGKWLFIRTRKHASVEPTEISSLASVDIWSYRDEVLIPAQRLGNKRRKTIDLVIAVDHNQNSILLNPDGMSTNIYPGLTNEIKGDHWILSSDTIENRESWWPHTANPQSWIVSLSDGKRTLLPFHNRRVIVSPTGRWVLFWVTQNGRSDYYCYEIETRRTTNITHNIPGSIAMENIPRVDSIPVGIAGWFKDDNSIAIYDNYDIWKVDPAGISKPINLTNGFGRRNKLKLRIVTDQNRQAIIDGKSSLILTGYNEDTKQNGFLTLKFGNIQDPVTHTMASFSWFKTESQIGNSAKEAMPMMVPIEFGNGSNRGWLLTGESSTDYRNYYYTKDLKKYTKITNLAPQKEVNWLKTELITWIMHDGKRGQGVLYKPENFDSTKKYPIIFTYYERYSGLLNSFLHPGFSFTGSINIPWFVSRGYLVFTPDIFFSIGSKSGITSCEHAYNSVISAVEYLSTRTYIDNSRMGIQGASFGGLITNYLVTHSSLFIAAAESGGFSDEVSSYLTLGGSNLLNPVDNFSLQDRKENRHALYGATLWERPELYFRNSPVLAAHKIAAPLLILHNRNDEQVQWRQGVEMYMACRRLAKPCWLLQYDNGFHGFKNVIDAKDFTIRLTQFFDHYLLNKPAPIWMTKGFPAALKQKEDRLEFDKNSSCHPKCKVCLHLNGNSKD